MAKNDPIVVVEGVNAQVGRLETLKKKSSLLARGVVEATLAEGQSAARAKAPGKTLPQSIQVRHLFSLGVISGEVYTKHPAAWWMENGTDPHVITPTNKKVLRFESDSGDIVFTKRVNHPGTEAYKFMDAGKRRMEKVFPTYMQKAFDNIE